MKFAALIFVMLDHTFQHWNPALTQTQFYNFVFLTQMPLFFFIAGYFAYKKAVSFARFPDFVRHELRLCASYLIPFFSFALRKWVSGGFTLSPFPNYLALVISHPQNGLWFLWVLFWMETILGMSTLLSGSIKKIRFKKCMTYVIYLFCLLAPTALYRFANDFGDSKLLIYYSLFFLLGPALVPAFEWVISVKECEKRHLLETLWAGIAALVLSISLKCNPSYLNSPDTLANISLRVLGSLSSLSIIFFVCDELCRFSWFCQISKLGRFSLETYYVHVFLLSFPLVDGFLNKWPFVLSFFTLVVVTYTVIFIVKTFPILDCFVFGKFPKRNVMSS